jgi:hypothetical protein
MYPSFGLQDNLYSESDLPQSIRFYGTSISKNSGEASYGNFTDGVFLEGSDWAVYRNGNRQTRIFLFYGDGGFIPDNDAIEDEFDDSYNVTIYNPTFDDPPTPPTSHVVKVSRISQREWIGGRGCEGKTVSLLYLFCNNYNFPLWQVGWGFCNIPEGATPGTSLLKYGDIQGVYLADPLVSVDPI